MLDKYKDLINKAKLAKLDTLSIWYSFFKMKEDPFLSQISSEEIDYFVDRDDVIDNIIYDMGVASRGIPITTLIIGPNGSGKTAILQYLQEVLKRLKQQYPDEYSFSGGLQPSNSLFENLEETGEKKEDVQLWVKICKESRDYLLVDDAKSTYVKTIMREFTRTKFKVFAISPLECNEVYASLPIAPKIQFLHHFDLRVAEQMLDKRIKRAFIDRGSDITIFDLFSEDALRAIHKYSMGVPGLILKCASKSLNLLLDIYRHSVAPNILEKQKVTLDIASRVCKVTKCFQAFTEFENISQIKIEVLQQILKSGRTPTEISSILRKDRTTISRHLNDLRELGLVEFTTRGRESVYEISEPLKVRFEIESMPKGEWNFASA